MNRITCEVAVIGAGPAGMAAALAARDAGAQSVVLLERDNHLGGILQQCIHNGFGLSYFREDLTGPEYAGRFIRDIHGSQIRCLLDTMVIHLDRTKRIVAVSPKHGVVDISPGAVVLAMGCRERPRGTIAVPGKRPAGVLTAGTAQRFINIEGILPGRKFVILGSGDIGMIMARRLRLEGCKVEAVVESQECVGGLSRNLVQCLQDYSIPLLLHHTVTNVYGSKRVTGVDVQALNGYGKPVGDAMRLDCDTLLLSVGLIPENELSKSAGIVLDEATRGPRVDDGFQTSAPGIFAAGNVLQVYDLVDNVTEHAETAGARAAQYALGTYTPGEKRFRIVPGKGIRSAVPQFVCGDEQTTFQIRCEDPVRQGNLQLVSSSGTVVYQKRIPIARPPEMLTVDVPSIGRMDAGNLVFAFEER